MMDAVHLDGLFTFEDGTVHDHAMARDVQREAVCVFDGSTAQFDGHGRTHRRPVVGSALRTGQRVDRRFGLFVFVLAFARFPREAIACEMRIERGFDAFDGGLWGINTS